MFVSCVECCDLLLSLCGFNCDSRLYFYVVTIAVSEPVHTVSPLHLLSPHTFSRVVSQLVLCTGDLCHCVDFVEKALC